MDLNPITRFVHVNPADFKAPVAVRGLDHAVVEADKKLVGSSDIYRNSRCGSRGLKASYEIRRMSLQHAQGGCKLDPASKLMFLANDPADTTSFFHRSE